MEKGKTYVWRDGEFIEKKKAPYRAVAPAVYADTIPRTYDSATGEYFESRSARRDAHKAAGVVAVDKNWTPTKKEQSKEEVLKEIKDDLEQTASDIAWGRSNDLTEQEKAECRELDEKDGYKPIKF